MTESFEPRENDQGIEVGKGNQPIVPSYPLDIFSDLQLANGRFSRQGLSWFAQTFFLMEQARTPEELMLTLKGYSSFASYVLNKSVLAEGLDICTEEGINELNNRCLTANKDSSEWWAAQLINEIKCLVNNSKIEEKEIQNVLWKMNKLTNSFSLLIFKEVIEPTFWSGYLINHLKDILKIWDDNQENNKEEFWQNVFSDNSIILSQVFSYPVILLEKKAYVGGKGWNNKGGMEVDFLLNNNLTKNIALIEIKTPKTKIIGSLYRSLYSLSADITGAIVQISNYKDSLTKEYHTLANKTKERTNAFNPQCILIAGNAQVELTSEEHIKTFELFRNGLKDVQLITYDELFRKIEILIDLIEGKK